MDSQINAAARALATGDVLLALKHVGLRDDPPALALRGVAMAQLGELGRARELLRVAARAFGSAEPLARARCITAEAEIALAARDLSPNDAGLVGARKVLEARGDRRNALHARCIEIRRLVILGQIERAERALAALDRTGASPALDAIASLLDAGVALRRIRVDDARAALDHAEASARRAGVGALLAEIAAARAALTAPAARRIGDGQESTLLLEDVAAIHASGALVIDGCRRVVRGGTAEVALGRRPVLFALARALAEAWPGDVARAGLIARAFGATRINESHRARLRVEIGRLRRSVRELAAIEATERGFVLRARRANSVVCLAPPTDDEHGNLLALLADGNAWSSSALSLALGASQRTTQRALVALEAAGRIRAFGRGRAQRWVAPALVGFTTVLLLPGPVVEG